MRKKISLPWGGLLCSLFILMPGFRMIPDAALQAQPILIDHTSTDLDLIPDRWLDTARQTLRIAYGHTSHGGQIISGMHVLAYEDLKYNYSPDGAYDTLSIHDREPEGDLGNPDRSTWYYRTRKLLDDPDNDRNVVIWSWCGQAGTADESDIELYLELMSRLEQDYPDVRFVYMTGHLNGTGESGDLFRRNNQIREFCSAHNKILFDFADIESYDPDGNYFRDKRSNDNCDYDSDGNGSLDSNWAQEWIAAHPDHKLTRLAGKCSSCAHSQPLNCILKANAFWTLLARLAGWDANACDADGNGGVSLNDLIQKNGQMQAELDSWTKNCLEKRMSCGDLNLDGFVDVLDRVQKSRELRQELADWSRRCGFKKKGTAIR